MTVATWWPLTRLKNYKMYAIVELQTHRIQALCGVRRAPSWASVAYEMRCRSSAHIFTQIKRALPEQS